MSKIVTAIFIAGVLLTACEQAQALDLYCLYPDGTMVKTIGGCPPGTVAILD